MVTMQVPELVQQKRAAFERVQEEFEKCFRYKQDVHGQKRFASFTIGEIVFYLHALWLCECKDRLLSVYKNIRRYEGTRCLELLRVWQEGRNAEVVAFLLATLDLLPFADLTAQIEEARYQQKDEALARRLEHGRRVLLNRGMNLMQILDAIYALSRDELLAEVVPACKLYGHTPAQIEGQLAEMETALFAYRPHPLLAQRNMVVMNRLDVGVLAQTTTLSNTHPWRLNPPDEPQAPFAEQVISGYLQMLAPLYNNVRGVRFVDRSEPERE